MTDLRSSSFAANVAPQGCKVALSEGGARSFSTGMKDSIQAYPPSFFNGKACSLCEVLMQEAQFIIDYRVSNGARKASSWYFSSSSD